MSQPRQQGRLRAVRDCLTTVDRRLRGPATPEEATLEELIAAFCDPRRAERLERRWARSARSQT